MVFRYIAAVGQPSCLDLCFGTFSLTDMAAEIYNETKQRLCIHGGSCDLLRFSFADTADIADLDLLLLAPELSTEQISMLQGIIQKYIATPSRVLRHENEAPFGFQYTATTLGGHAMKMSLTVYTSTPDTPMYDDIAHSDILFLKPRQKRSSKYGDLVLVDYLKEHKYLLTPQSHRFPQLIFRIAMREAKGWEVHNLAMDKRVYDAGGEIWNNTYALATSLSKTWKNHFEETDALGYLKLVFFLLSRHQRMCAETDRRKALWAALSPNIQRQSGVEICHLADLAAHIETQDPRGPKLHKYLVPLANRLEQVAMLCKTWSSCQTVESQAIVAADLKEVFEHVLTYTMQCPLSFEIQTSESAWDAVYRHLAVFQSQGKTLSQPIRNKLLYPAIQHADLAQSACVLAQLEIGDMQDYRYYLRAYPEHVFEWLKFRLSAPSIPYERVMLYLEESSSEALFKPIVIALAKQCRDTEKTDLFYTLWEKSVAQVRVCSVIGRVFATLFTALPQWGYPDEKMLPAIRQRFMQLPPCDHCMPLHLEIDYLAHLTAADRPASHDLSAYTRALFLSANWHAGYTLNRALFHVVHFFQSRPKLQESILTELFQSHPPRDTADALAALAYREKTSFPHHPGWVQTIAYLLENGETLTADLTSALWDMVLLSCESLNMPTEQTHRRIALFQASSHLRRHLVESMSEAPERVAKLPDLHQILPDLVLDEEAKVYVLRHAPEEGLLRCAMQYLWESPVATGKVQLALETRVKTDQTLSQPTRDALLQSSVEQCQKYPRLSLSLGLMASNTKALTTLIADHEAMRCIDREMYTAAVTCLLRCPENPLNGCLSGLFFEKLTATLQQDVARRLSIHELGTLLGPYPDLVHRVRHETLINVVSLLDVVTQKTLIQQVFKLLTVSDVQKVVANHMAEDPTSLRTIMILEWALAKIPETSLDPLFSEYPSVLYLFSPQDCPNMHKAWAKYLERGYLETRETLQTFCDYLDNNKKKDPLWKEAAISRAARMFEFVSPTTKTRLIRDCPRLIRLPFYLQNKTMLLHFQGMETSQIGTALTTECVLLPIKADNVDFMKTWHEMLKWPFDSPCLHPDTAKQSTLFQVAVDYGAEGYVRYLGVTFQEKIQDKELRSGGLLELVLRNKLQELGLLIRNIRYIDTVYAHSKRDSHLWAMFKGISQGAICWDPRMGPKAALLEGLQCLVRANYLDVNRRLDPGLDTIWINSLQHATKDLSFLIVHAHEIREKPTLSFLIQVLCVECQIRQAIDDNGLSYFLLELGMMRPNALYLSGLLLAHGLCEEAGYKQTITDRIVRCIADNIRVSTRDIAELFQVMAGVVSGDSVLRVIDSVLAYQREVLLAEDHGNVFRSVVLANPGLSGVHERLLAAGFKGAMAMQSARSGP